MGRRARTRGWPSSLCARREGRAWVGGRDSAPACFFVCGWEGRGEEGLGSGDREEGRGRGDRERPWCNASCVCGRDGNACVGRWPPAPLSGLWSGRRWTRVAGPPARLWEKEGVKGSAVVAPLFLQNTGRAEGLNFQPAHPPHALAQDEEANRKERGEHARPWPLRGETARPMSSDGPVLLYCFTSKLRAACSTPRPCGAHSNATT